MRLSATIMSWIVSLALFAGGFAFTQTATAAGSGGGGGSFNTGPVEENLSPEQMSERALRQGIRHRDRALKQEAKAAKAKTDKKRDKALARAQKEFEKAKNKQAEALKLNPQNYKAANELGYALRKLGDFRKAIGAYNYALEINPEFHQATEYRAEAFLALGYYDLAQEAYMKLFREDRALADQLMTSFQSWKAAKSDAPTEPEAAFLSWANQNVRATSQ